LIPARRPLPEKLFRAAIAALGALMCARMGSAAVQESQTWDEGLHLVAGFSYWKTGDYRLNPEHPPLAKLAAALPLLFTSAALPDLPEAWRQGDQVALFRPFLYANTVDADTLLLLGRLMTMLSALALGLLLAAAARARWGAAAGLTSAALYATDPNFIAHGHYITSDVPVTLAILTSVLTWDRYLTTGRRLDLAAASAALGIALATKFSAIFLLPLHWIVYWLRCRGETRHPLAACAGAVLVLLMAYSGDSFRALTGKKPPLERHIGTAAPAAAYASGIASDLRLPAHPYLTGSWDLFQHSREGHRSYLLGKVSDQGSIWYFPVAFAVKTPAAVLILLLLVAAPALAAAARQIPRATWALAAYPAAYLALCLTSRLNLGLRHLLPLYPFLYLAIAWAVAFALNGRRRRYAIAALAVAAAVQFFELARVHPHYTAFFNSLSGGPQNGYRFLLDSNLDWGQDMKKVKRWFETHDVRQACYSYFGSAPVEYYGLSPWIPAPDPETPDCVAAVGATNLFDVYFDPPRHRPLRERTPDAVIGHSTWIFDLRKDGAEPP
jgi:hypothetical protein